jgi:hypothetical protein
MGLLVVLATLAAGFWLACAIAVTGLMVRVMRRPDMNAAPALPPTIAAAPPDGTPQPEQEICECDA